MNIAVATALGFAVMLYSLCCPAAEVFIRANQVGYSLQDKKIALVLSAKPVDGQFEVLRQGSGEIMYTGFPRTLARRSWGKFLFCCELDFSTFDRAGVYLLRVGSSESCPFRIGPSVYSGLPDQLLEFLRQQRCGYNPWLDARCHSSDGRTVFGLPATGTHIDATGGWHDAADLLKYLLTSGNATAQLLLAYRTGAVQNTNWSGVFRDDFDKFGRSGRNGMPDILDEARWGLDWLLKLHPEPDQLYHQVADDRDHIGLRLPQNEIADYGWGKGGARVVYFADGRPQGLQQFMSESTGIANLAGRYAAAMGLAWQIWKDDPEVRDFAARCLQAGREIYEMGRTQQGVQQGNSYRAPYRYEESTWADDMEWGAAELFRATGERSYLEQAKRYSRLAADDSWMGKQQTKHYQYYPFMNLGHYRLYGLVDKRTQSKLTGYYRTGIEKCVRAGAKNPFRAGVPFIWCSNNLMTALATQCLLYERMTGDERYREFGDMQRDWLLGRNPWGYSMFTEIGTTYPKQPHLMTSHILKRPVRGGLVDGPVYEHIFKSLRGVSLSGPDLLADFQGMAVYHDDFHDYSSNEPTMDGTASAVLLFALCSSQNR